jgi:hypothetical protein
MNKNIKKNNAQQVANAPTSFSGGGVRSAHPDECQLCHLPLAISGELRVYCRTSKSAKRRRRRLEKRFFFCL